LTALDSVVNLLAEKSRADCLVGRH